MTPARTVRDARSHKGVTLIKLENRNAEYQARVDRARQLRLSGMSREAICLQLGVSDRTLKKYLAEAQEYRFRDPKGCEDLRQALIRERAR